MFELNICLHPNCNKLALSQIDKQGNITNLPGYCLEHTPNPDDLKNAIYKYIEKNKKIINLNACDLTFSNIDLTDKCFIACNFKNCTFQNIQSEYFRSRMSFFDFSLFSDCNFINSDIQFSSFIGSTFSIALFTGSELIQNSFNGITAYQTSFDDSDLYLSRFCNARLLNTSIVNCNIKKAIFHNLHYENVSFKQSNTGEAIFLDEKIMGGVI